jgi:hypothetical protein
MPTARSRPLSLFGVVLVTSIGVFGGGPAFAQGIRPTEQQATALGPPADRIAPGFAVVDSSTMSIEHMTPMQTVKIDVFSSLRKNDLIPRDISLEVVPALTRRTSKALTVKEWFDRLYFPTMKGRLAQNFAAAMAVSQDVTRPGATNPESLVALTLRTLLLSGTAPRTLNDIVTKLDHASTELNLESQKPSPDQDNITELFVQTRALRQELIEADKEHVGVLLEVGGAWVLEVPEHTISQSKMGRKGFWVNPIYRFDRWPVDVSGVGRFLAETTTDSNLFDLGGRAGVTAAGIHYAIEGYMRHRWIAEPLAVTGSDLTNGRLVGLISFGFNRSTHVNFTFGKNFKNDYMQGGSLLASFGLSIGLGGIPFGNDGPG